MTLSKRWSHLAAGCAIAVATLSGISCLRRPSPVPFGDVVTWQGGTVADWDYCEHPGSYDTYFEWVGPAGQRKRLIYTGDDEAVLMVLPNGDLQVRFPDPQAPRVRLPRYVIWTWTSPTALPNRQSSDP